jgi:hypothetical protein
MLSELVDRLCGSDERIGSGSQVCLKFFSALFSFRKVTGNAFCDDAMIQTDKLLKLLPHRYFPVISGCKPGYFWNFGCSCKEANRQQAGRFPNQSACCS